MTTIGLLLAAGAGTRMGQPAALLGQPDGTSWLQRSVAALTEGGCDEVYVVLGAEADRARTLLPAGVKVVIVEDWASGQSASLRAGLHALPAIADAALVSLVDLHDVDTQVVARVLAAMTDSSVLARATYAGQPGHPVLIGRSHWYDITGTATGDPDARDYLARHDVTLIECGDLATGRDLDSPVVEPSTPAATVSGLLAHDTLIVDQVTSFMSNDFDILDAAGAAVGRIVTGGSGWSRLLMGSRELTVLDADGSQQVFVNDVPTFGRDRIELSGPTGEHLAVITKEFTFFKLLLSVKAAQGALSASGDFFEYNFSVDRPEGTVAQIRRTHRGLGAMLMGHQRYVIGFDSSADDDERRITLGIAVAVDLIRAKQQAAATAST